MSKCFHQYGDHSMIVGGLFVNDIKTRVLDVVLKFIFHASSILNIFAIMCDHMQNRYFQNSSVIDDVMTSHTHSHT